MLWFIFRANKSFLTNNAHPVTIPSSNVPYNLLLDENLDHREINMLFPRGEKYEAKIYKGCAGYGQYYQLRLIGKNRQLPDYLAMGDRLLVILCRIDKISLIILEHFR